MPNLFKLFSLLLLTSLFAFVQPVADGCTILHTGTFKYHGGSDIIVKINGTKHTEFHDNGKYIIESKLDWVNDCEYNMTMTKITIPDFPYKPGDVMNVKVDNVIGKEIYYTSTVKGQSWRGRLMKISDSID